MRFAAAVARLEALPDVLPEGPAALVPRHAPSGAPLPEGPAARVAAVLVLVFPGAAGEARVVLIERASGGGHHAGEAAFPGGRAEPGDPDLVATALREAAEETGLDPGACGLRVLGTLPPFAIPVSGHVVTPVVAAAARPPELRPAEAEVVRILTPPLAAFLPGAALEHVERDVPGMRLAYAGYRVEGLHVWGMTARVLGGLGEHLAG